MAILLVSLAVACYQFVDSLVYSCSYDGSRCFVWVIFTGHVAICGVHDNALVSVVSSFWGIVFFLWLKLVLGLQFELFASHLQSFTIEGALIRAWKWSSPGFILIDVVMKCCQLLQHIQLLALWIEIELYNTETASCITLWTLTLISQEILFVHRFFHFHQYANKVICSDYSTCRRCVATLRFRPYVFCTWLNRRFGFRHCLSSASACPVRMLQHDWKQDTFCPMSRWYSTGGCLVQQTWVGRHVACVVSSWPNVMLLAYQEF